MTQVTNWICYSTGKSFKIGDEVEDANARFFIGAINDSHALCAIDKSKPWTAKNPGFNLVEFHLIKNEAGLNM